LFFQGSDQKRIGCHAAAQSFETVLEEANHHYLTLGGRFLFFLHVFGGHEKVHKFWWARKGLVAHYPRMSPLATRLCTADHNLNSKIKILER